MQKQDRSNRLLIWRAKLLRAALFIFNEPVYQPRNGLTYCNLAVQAWARSWDYKPFDGKLANQMSEIMQSSVLWVPVSPRAAMEAAFMCRMVVAHTQAQPHGHVAAVLPIRDFQPDGMTWAEVTVLSMGKTPLVGAKASRAFKSEPMFHTYAAPNKSFPWWD